MRLIRLSTVIGTHYSREVGQSNEHREQNVSEKAEETTTSHYWIIAPGGCNGIIVPPCVDFLSTCVLCIGLVSRFLIFIDNRDDRGM